LEEGLATAEAAGDKLQVARAELLLGEVARILGQPERSVAWLEKALSDLRAVGDLALAAAALTGMALSRAQTGEVAAAVAHLREGLEISGHMQNPWLVNLTGERTALVGSKSAESELLAEMLGALGGLKRRQGVRGLQETAEQERLQALISELEARLGYAAFYEVWRRGNRHSLEETICVIGRVLDCLSTAALGTVSPPAGDAEGVSPVARDVQAAETNDALTVREREVLALAAEGLANRQIASRMGIADRTVKQHLSAAFRKLRVSNRVDAVAAARKRGIL
jgi:DNA-binding CsgD family transcriptional regulator